MATLCRGERALLGAALPAGSLDGSAAPPAPLPVTVTGSLRLGSARAAVAELVQLFPRGLFEDALPAIALRSQVYSLVPDRTAADRQLVRGVGATDGSRFPASSALPRAPITQTPGRSASRSAVLQASGLPRPGTTGPRKMPQTLLKDPPAVESMPHRGSGRTNLLGKLSHRA